MMNARPSILRLAVLGLCAGGTVHAGVQPTGISSSPSSPYRYVVSVGCAQPNGQTVAYVWHTAVVAEREGDRIFKELAAPDFEDCLSEIARTKTGLYELLANLGPQSGQDVTREIMEQASETWSQFGVYEALQEVATTGSRGPKVKALLDACDNLSRKRKGAAEAK
jgi:hypothetical protein